MLVGEHGGLGSIDMLSTPSTLQNQEVQGCAYRRFCLSCPFVIRVAFELPCLSFSPRVGLPVQPSVVPKEMLFTCAPTCCWNPNTSHSAAHSADRFMLVIHGSSLSLRQKA